MRAKASRAAGARAVPLGAVALAFVMGASPLLGTLHAASVRHVPCPEDGDLVEALVGPRHDHPQAGADLALFPEQPLKPSAAGTNHDHCIIALSVFGHSSALFSQPAAFITPAGPAPAPAPRALAGIDRKALYRLAPKASPPA